jgi:hypothetical protein
MQLGCLDKNQLPKVVCSKTKNDHEKQPFVFFKKTKTTKKYWGKKDSSCCTHFVSCLGGFMSCGGSKF